MPPSEFRQQVLGSVNRLDTWVASNGWAGFDPHDIRGTPLFLFLGRENPSVLVRVVRKPLILFEVYFPDLARKLLRLQPTINAKGMGLFAKAYLQLFAQTGDERYRTKGIECLEWLLKNRSPEYAEPCWGYPFDWQSGVFTPAGTPASVVCSAVGDAFWAAWKILGDAAYLEVCEGICRFFLTHLRQDRMPDGTLCFSYTPIDDFHVHNANLLVAEFLIRVGQQKGHDEWQTIGKRAADYALKEQNADGSIYYWGRVQDHYNPRSIDHYHTGFEIRCLFGISQLTNENKYREAAKRYHAFYLENLISRRDGCTAPKMTPKSFYPVNIHSCAEALLLNTTLGREFPEAGALVRPLFEWIVGHMQAANGSFIYMIRRVFGWEVRSRIPYVRWGQAWMLLALSECLLAENE